MSVLFTLLMAAAGTWPFGLDLLAGKGSYAPREIAAFNDKGAPLVMEGVVGGEPQVKGDALYLQLEVQNLRSGSQTYPVRGRVLLKTELWPAYYYGDRLRVSGKLQSPELTRGSGEDGQSDKFSYGDYLAKDGIFSVIYKPQIQFLGSGQEDGWSLLFGLKEFINERINRLFGAPAAGIIGGILIGTRSGVPPEVMDSFNRAGLTHILAISGYNITLLINITAFLARGCGRRARLAITLAVIFFFALLTGISASVVRASLMGGITVLALNSGRRGNALNALLLGGALMVVFNNRILLSDISFQLSFMSTLGLILLMPIFEDVMSRLGKALPFKIPAFINDGLLVTTAAQIFTTPLTLYYFGRFSLISFVTNIIFLPLIPLSMALSFAALVSSVLLLPWTMLFVALDWLCLQILVGGVGIFSAIPWASLEIKNFGLLAMAVYYALTALFIVYKSRLAKGS